MLLQKKKTHRRGHVKVKEEDAEHAANDNANAGSKVLGNVVGVVDADGGQQSSNCLEDNGSPNDAVVPVKEPVLRNLLTIVVDDTDEEGREKRIEGELNVASPNRHVGRGVLEHLLKVNTGHSRDDSSDQAGGQSSGVVHHQVSAILVLLDTLVCCRALGELRSHAFHTPLCQLARHIEGRASGLAQLVDGSGEEVVAEVVDRQGVVVRRRERDDGNAECEHDEGQPALDAQRAAKHNDAEESSSDDLDTVSFYHLPNILTAQRIRAPTLS